MKSGKKSVTYVLLMVVIVGVLLIGFWKMATRDFGDSTDTVKTTPISDVITKNLDATYPPTPREVVKFYSQILVCFYNENASEEEIRNLGNQARALFDEQLLENNPEEQYFEDLNQEIEEYKKNNCTIVNYSVEDSDKVQYIKKDGSEFAMLTAQYFIKNNGEYEKTIEDYVLRKDSNGRWKIYGYTISKDDSSSDE